MYQIESNIPVPDKGRGGAGRHPKYPFARLSVGDSFFAAGTTAQEKTRVESAARSFGVDNGVKFTTQRSPDGVRVWRIA